MAAAKKTPRPSEGFQNMLVSMINMDRAYSLPSSVRILGRQVPIKLVTDIEEDGEFDYKACSIKVKANQTATEEADTVLHEILHGIDHWMDLGLDERQVRLMATALIGLFQDNPEFAEYITRPMRGEE